MIEYRLEGVEGAEPLYRLATTIPDHELAPAMELTALYHDRCEMETAFDELKTHLRGARIVPRSKAPNLVRREFYGLLMAHFAVRGLMHEAALKSGEDPIGYRFSTSFALFAARSRPSAPFPLRDRNKFHQTVLKEILDETRRLQPNRRRHLDA